MATRCCVWSVLTMSRRRRCLHLVGIAGGGGERTRGPMPLPSTVKKRGLNERERLLYAPMADVGGSLYDKDAVYIDIGR